MREVSLVSELQCPWEINLLKSQVNREEKQLRLTQFTGYAEARPYPTEKIQRKRGRKKGKSVQWEEKRKD